MKLPFIKKPNRKKIGTGERVFPPEPKEKQLKKPEHGLFFRKCQFFLIFCLFLPFAQAKKDQKSFVCGYKPVVEYVNSLISLDRALVEYYRSKVSTGTLTQAERAKLVRALIRYRFLPIKEEQGKCRFYSFLCVDHQKKTIQEMALEYLRKNPNGPVSCYISDGGRERKVAFMSDLCTSAIQKRIRPIPYPLGIAQAGLESAWGSSYFAREGYNFFGVQTRFSSSAQSKNNAKCIPARRNNTKCVYKFDSPENSFFIYSQMLNSSGTYIRLRNIRYQSEQAGDTSCDTALKMSNGLDSYAEDPKYKQKVRNAIRQICNILESC